MTLEDVVEEIVGEIYDENDSKEEIRKRAGYIIGRDNDIYDIDANTSIDHLEEELNLEIPEVSNHPPAGTHWKRCRVVATKTVLGVRFRLSLSPGLLSDCPVSCGNP